MNKKLFLTSSFEDVYQLLPTFEENLAGKKVTFIPTASLVEETVFFVEAGKKALESLGLIVDVLELSTSTLKEIKLKLTNNDIIYVTGGNTFFLLQEMQKSNADKLIATEVNSGKLYIGESAGAVITAKNIEYVSLLDSPEKASNLKQFNGLGLVDFYTLPHYNNEPFQEIAHKIANEYSSEINLVPISNDEAILVKGNDISIKRE